MDLGIIAYATTVTIFRILLLIGLSIVLGWILAYVAIKSRWFENIYVAVINVLESIPVIAFFPLVLVVFIQSLGGGLGVETAADFLVFDAVVWNVWIGIYQAFKTVPGDLLEIAENYDFSFYRIMKDLYIPYSVPRITSNMFSSFADGMFYITVSEVFSVGLTTYHTFGIGSLLTSFLAQGDTADVYASLLSIAIGVIIMTVIFSKMNRWAVAKFGKNTDIVIKRRTGPLQKYLQREEQFVVSKLKAAAKRLSGQQEYPSIPITNPYQHRHLLTKEEMSTLRYLGLVAVAFVFAYIGYWAYSIATSVSWPEWVTLFDQTPFLLYSMAADYVRVVIITAASLVLAVVAGYYLAVHSKLGQVVAPLIQAVAAFPAPAYFPLIFISTLPFMEQLFPMWYSEVYIFVLGFLSCFYYVFFDFWTGIQSIPVEFWEIMKNYKLGFWTRIRKIIVPGTLPYLITGLSSTINSAWAGIAIGEYWPNIYGNHTLEAGVGMMKYISLNMASGQVADAAWVSLLFGFVVAVYGIVFTRNLMAVARKKYVVEEGIYS